MYIARCGPSVLNATKEVQVLTSPNFPNKYPNNIKCTWFIKKGATSKPTFLKFVTFDLLNEHSPDYDTITCNKDRVEITEKTVQLF